MKIVLNGKEESLQQPRTIKEFIAVRKWDSATVVVELNSEIIDQGHWTDIVLRDGDRLEILRFVGGGSA